MGRCIVLNEDINILLFLLYNADYLQYSTDFNILNKLKKTLLFHPATGISYHLGTKQYTIFQLTTG